MKINCSCSWIMRQALPNTNALPWQIDLAAEHYKLEPGVDQDACPLQWWLAHRASHLLVATFAAKFLSSLQLLYLANSCFRLLVTYLIRSVHHSVPATWTDFFASTAGWINKQDLWLVVWGIYSSCNFHYSEQVSNLEFVQNCVMCYFCNVCRLFWGNFDSYPQGSWNNILQLEVR